MVVAEAALWGGLAASSLLVGMVFAFVWAIPPKVVGLVLAFGAGALFSAIAFELVVDAIERGNHYVLAAGMIVGAVSYIGGVRMLERQAGQRR